MKVTETIERECCDGSRGDLKTYRGRVAGFPYKGNDLAFCIHCGQVWERDYHTDAAGGRDWNYVRVPLK